MCQDLLLKRYGAAYYTLIQDYFEDVFDIFVHAVKQRNEDILMLRWMIGYQEISFDEFKSKLGVGKESIKTNESIDDIMQRMSIF